MPAGLCQSQAWRRALGPAPRARPGTWLGCWRKLQGRGPTSCPGAGLGSVPVVASCDIVRQGPPANEDTREKAAQGVKAFEELLVTKCKSLALPLAPSPVAPWATPGFDCRARPLGPGWGRHPAAHCLTAVSLASLLSVRDAPCVHVAGARPRGTEGTVSWTVCGGRQEGSAVAQASRWAPCRRPLSPQGRAGRRPCSGRPW